ncbi:hypothetical protein MSAN_00244300 [Mycena sanguinolenta]|uniref:CxC5 like cysteine cluster associated with KDZ domain-containing protein n=1 Tax=Mycena sanguinolenta TaxID=230812 RepID=A0A8H6ZI32_9AGAR|nr:hypothetical protein MSAN_00244300 [Mycena sanguinolenta]
MASMDDVHAFLSKVPGLVESITMEKAMAFVRLASRLKDEIILAQKSTYDPSSAPSDIPEHVRSFLGCATGMSDEFVAGCWEAFSETIWHYNEDETSAGRDAQMFREYGFDHLLSARTLFPPNKQCTTPGCMNQNLLKDKDGVRKVVLFTLSDGACATYSVHLYCPHCKTSYQNNYSVHGGIRTYYAGVPDAIQVGEHQFTSATNAARVYDSYLSKPEWRPNHKDWPPSLFQLRGRLQRANVSHPNDAFAAEVTAEEVEEMDVPASGECEASKDPNGNRKLRALFGRRRTHNEQIFVRPCGMIVAHATFYGSESVSQTVDMLQKVFHVDGSMPDIVIYDNNCTLYKYLVRNNIPLYESIGFPVDVFHWTCKHAKESIECSYHCNPTLFPELLGTDGKAWFFNSSIAEQTNVWLGGYHSILREMGSDRYDFFLDEMVMRKNRLTKTKLEAAGALPDYVPNLTYYTPV